MPANNDDNPFLPPMDSEYPIVITNQLYEDENKRSDKIKEIITTILGNPNMDTLVAVAPFISEYFVKLLAKTTLKYLILIINREDLNPEYVENAVKVLNYAKFDVEVRARPPGSKFIHMKVMVPYMKISRIDKSEGKARSISKIIPTCAIAGSVNFTKNGIAVSDEMLVIFRDPYSINACLETYRKLLEGTVLKHSSKGYVEMQRQIANKT